MMMMVMMMDDGWWKLWLWWGHYWWEPKILQTKIKRARRVLLFLCSQIADCKDMSHSKRAWNRGCSVLLFSCPRNFRSPLKMARGGGRGGSQQLAAGSFYPPRKSIPGTNFVRPLRWWGLSSKKKNYDTASKSLKPLSFSTTPVGTTHPKERPAARWKQRRCLSEDASHCVV